MSFKVKDLMIKVSGAAYDEASTCTTWTRPTGGASGGTCIDSAFFQGERTARHGLAVLKAQLRQAAARA